MQMGSNANVQGSRNHGLAVYKTVNVFPHYESRGAGIVGYMH